MSEFLARVDVLSLNGPSGAGKGVGGEKIIQTIVHRGKVVVAAEAGVAFRNLESLTRGESVEVGRIYRPGRDVEPIMMQAGATVNVTEIVAQRNGGAMIPTLEPIRSQMETVFSAMGSEAVRSGSVVGVIDGAFRLPAREQVPSQVVQVARFAANGFAQMGQEVSVASTVAKLEDSTHTLVDVRSRDAIDQIKGRADKKLVEYMAQTGLSITAIAVAEVYRGLLRGDVKGETAEYYKQHMTEFGLPVRADDIFGAEKRVGVYVTETEDQAVLGPVGEAMVALGFSFCFESRTWSAARDRRVVIPNGKSRGVSLEEFTAACEGFARTWATSVR